MQQPRDIFAEVTALDLPGGAYLVIGGGVLSAHGIRPHEDIDLLVTPELFATLPEMGWESKEIRPDFTVLIRGHAEASAEMITLPNYTPPIAELFAHPEFVHGVPCMPLSELIRFKQALGREKDLRDIELVRAHLLSCSCSK